MKKLLLVTLLSSFMVGCGSDDSSSNAPVINNTAPTASDTQVDATENTLMSGTLTKAIDADGDKLTYTLTAQAANGEANVNPNGTYTYMPNPDFHGEDSFAYSVSDGRGGKITRKAIINVSSVNQAPSASGKRDGIITLESTVVEKKANILLNTSDGRLVAVGQNNSGEVILERYDIKGNVDVDFNNGQAIATGLTNIDSSSITVDKNGAVFIAGEALSGSKGNLTVVKYSRNGNLDLSFEVKGINSSLFNTSLSSEELSSAIDISNEGKILLVGYNSSGSIITRYNKDGTLDKGFGIRELHRYDIRPYIIKAINDGTTLVISSRLSYPTVYSGGVYGFKHLRFNADGSSIGNTERIDSGVSPSSISITDDGDVYFGGSSNFLLKINGWDKNNGYLFPNRSVGIDNLRLQGRDVTVDSNGKLLIMGATSYDNSPSDFVLARFNKDSSLDASFNASGNNSGKAGVLITDSPYKGLGYDLKVTPTGEIFILAEIKNKLGANQRTIISFDKDGNTNSIFGNPMSLQTQKNTDLVLNIVDFGFNDSDGDNFEAVIIDKLPETGVLLLNGAAVSLNQKIKASEIETGKLIFRPTTDTSGKDYANFTYRVQDDGGTDNGGNDISNPATLVIDVI
jgi:uncharacterized delta-60 repeat protein